MNIIHKKSKLMIIVSLQKYEFYKKIANNLLYPIKNRV